MFPGSIIPVATEGQAGDQRHGSQNAVVALGSANRPVDAGQEPRVEAEGADHDQRGVQEVVRRCSAKYAAISGAGALLGGDDSPTTSAPTTIVNRNPRPPIGAKRSHRRSRALP